MSIKTIAQVQELTKKVAEQEQTIEKLTRDLAALKAAFSSIVSKKS